MEQDFRADKNRPLADAHQGAHLTERTAYEAWEQQKKTRTDWGSQEGSVTPVGTPVQIERIAREGDLSEDMARSVLKNYIVLISLEL